MTAAHPDPRGAQRLGKLLLDARRFGARDAAQVQRGTREELEPARAKAEAMGVKQIFIDDLREEFVRDYVFPMFRANALYEVGRGSEGWRGVFPCCANALCEVGRGAQT